MRREPALMALHPERREELVAVMAELAGSGRGWINLTPDVDPDEVPPDPGPLRIFSAVGPPVPLCTWTPPDRRKAAPHALIGVQHGTGARLAKRLAELEVPLAEGWRVVQDEPKKGLVVAVPDGEGDDTVLRWLLATGAALCPFPYSSWVAAVYR